MVTFITQENGAVTVDWVVLTAALVGLGLATMGVVSSGVEDVSGDIDTQLKATEVTSLFASTIVSRYDPLACPDGLAGVTQVAEAMVATNATDGDEMPGITDDINAWAGQSNQDTLDTYASLSGQVDFGLSYDETLELGVATCEIASRGL